MKTPKRIQLFPLVTQQKITRSSLLCLQKVRAHKSMQQKLLTAYKVLQKAAGEWLCWLAG